MNEGATGITGGEHAKYGNFPYTAVHQLTGNGIISQYDGLSKKMSSRGRPLRDIHGRIFRSVRYHRKSVDFLREVSMITTEVRVRNNIALFRTPHAIPFSDKYI